MKKIRINLKNESKTVAVKNNSLQNLRIRWTRMNSGIIRLI